MTARPWYATTGFVASAVFLVLVVAAGVALAVSSGGPDGDVRARARVNAATGGSVCGLPAGSQDPVVGPPVASWTLVGTIAAPTVRDVGPGVLDHGDRRCFAHSPAGALVAAANLAAMISLPSGAISRQDGLRHVVPSRTRAVYSTQPVAPVDPNLRLQIVGFRVAAVGRDDVNVTLALRSNLNGGAMVWWTLPMHWMTGDWRARLGSIDEPFIGGPLNGLDGYVRWAGA
jgi:hypothetical protein